LPALAPPVPPATAAEPAIPAPVPPTPALELPPFPAPLSGSESLDEQPIAHARLVAITTATRPIMTANTTRPREVIATAKLFRSPSRPLVPSIPRLMGIAGGNQEGDGEVERRDGQPPSSPCIRV